MRVGTVVTVIFIALVAGYVARTVFLQQSRSPEELAAVAPVKTFLDFRNQTAERSDVPVPQTLEVTPHLQSALLDIQIVLPLGTEDGSYLLELHDVSGVTTRQTTGTAKWDGKNETYSAELDLRKIRPGKYTLVLQKRNSSQRKYSVIVE
jgi:hypothetical protein